MPVALAVNEQWTYIVKEDAEAYKAALAAFRKGEGPNPPAPTQFKLKALTAAEKARIDDQTGVIDPSNGHIRALAGTHELDILRHGLAGWEEFYTADGKPVQFKSVPDPLDRKRMVASDESLSAIPPDCRAELAEAIVRHNVLTFEELGN